ncbi:hypothetical protein P7L53_13765 [Thermoleptolyngbya sichuanensis XZ-Cy5]|uniref:hypothetical protein n=1 Tax=Thermoleptolyngbya sichuanensis TaxID=2885951 RepID=UPI00240D936E|nr:hypothetical protein [Thermoleptolyngbya sichuanensis]MDG2617306.1 hypothetical protein [Thermoleptolyngbya sichuanensis XZ-Cy5]
MVSFTAAPPNSALASPHLLTAAILQLPMPDAADRVASGQVVRALQTLMALIDEVRAPENGWDANTLPTPEAIAPYVADEACDLLEALETSEALAAETNDRTFPSEAADSPKPAPLWPPYCTLDSLTPRLLWGLARSAVEVMRLLESVSATVAPAGAVRQRGRLRLAAVLELHAEDGSQRHDLVMHQPGRSPLSLDAQVYELDGTAVSGTLTAGQILTAIAQQVELVTPALSPLLVGLPIQLLLPEYDWQPATLRLHLELEFVPGGLPASSELPNAVAAGAAEASEPHDAMPSNDEETLPTTLQFTPGAWLQRYCTHLRDYALAHQALHLSGCRMVSEAVFPLPAEEVVPRLVADACLLLDLQTYSPLFAPIDRWQDRMPGDRLRSRLLWSLSRSSPAMMQLLGGVKVRMLQPEAPWDAGTLRLLVTLKLQTPEMDWYIDLATGQMPEPTVFPLAADVVLQAGDLAFEAQPEAALPPLSLQQPTPLAQLTEHVMQQIETAVPEVHLLLEGAAVDLWSEADPEPHPATLQVLVDFDFVPDWHLTPDPHRD